MAEQWTPTTASENKPWEQWLRPTLDGQDREECERTAHSLHIPLATLIDAFERGTLQPLDEATWALLQNTDSHHEKTREQIADMAEAYGKPRARTDRLFAAMEQRRAVIAPIVLFRRDHAPYLIAGNTRLCVARSLGVTPYIIAMHTGE